MAFYTLVIKDADLSATELANRLDLEAKHTVLRSVGTYLSAVNSGTRRALVRAYVASAAASQTVTCDQSAAVDDTDTITIAGTELAVVAEPGDTSEFAKGDTDTEFASNLAAAINANATLAKVVSATADDDEVTITCLFPGPVGNLVTLAEVGDGFTLGASALASGASDEVDSYTFGTLT